MAMPAIGQMADSLDPFSQVKSARVFSIGKVGYAGRLSKDEIAFRSVLKGRNPAEKFIALVHTATPEGQLYALLGLRLLGDPAFDKYFPSFVAKRDLVRTMEGCIMGRASMKSVASGIRRGNFK